MRSPMFTEVEDDRCTGENFGAVLLALLTTYIVHRFFVMYVLESCLGCCNLFEILLRDRRLFHTTRCHLSL